MTDVAGGHTVRSYDQELQRLRCLVLEMGEFVLAQTSKAVAALSCVDVGQARHVVDQERKLDGFELDADDLTFNLIAKRQPAAIDLRLILGLSKAVGNLSRAGNRAEGIGWCTIRLFERQQHPSARVLHHLARMHELAYGMLRRALDALAAVDVDLALDAFAEDTSLDAEHDAAMRHLMTFVLEDPAMVGQILELGYTLRALNCIGNQGGSIAEHVIFIAKGKDVRYQNREILMEALGKRSSSP